MTGDCHVQFSESARVRFPRATRLIDENMGHENAPNYGDYFGKPGYQVFPQIFKSPFLFLSEKIKKL